jgi:hypothetical protein
MLGSRLKGATREEIETAKRQADPPKRYDRLWKPVVIPPRAETPAEKAEREAKVRDELTGLRGPC